MSSTKPIVFTVSMTTNASLSEGRNLGGSYKNVWVAFGAAQGDAFGAGTAIFPQGSYDGTTYHRLAYLDIQTATAAPRDFVISTNTTSRMVLLPNFGFPYIRFETTAVVTTPTAIFRVICAD